MVLLSESVLSRVWLLELKLLAPRMMLALQHVIRIFVRVVFGNEFELLCCPVLLGTGMCGYLVDPA